MATGFEAARFWKITPKEVEREMHGAGLRREREHNERAWLAWHIVALDRTKKLPKLETLLISGKQARPQTPEEHELALKAIFLAFGGDPKDLRTLQ